METVGSVEEDADLGTLVRGLVSKDYEVVASMRAELCLVNEVDEAAR